MVGLSSLVGIPVEDCIGPDDPPGCTPVPSESPSPSPTPTVTVTETAVPVPGVTWADFEPYAVAWSWGLFLILFLMLVGFIVRYSRPKGML